VGQDIDAGVAVAVGNVVGVDATPGVGVASPASATDGGLGGTSVAVAVAARVAITTTAVGVGGSTVGGGGAGVAHAERSKTRNMISLEYFNIRFTRDKIWQRV
jgi:hypothetical protein